VACEGSEDINKWMFLVKRKPDKENIYKRIYVALFVMYSLQHATWKQDV